LKDALHAIEQEHWGGRKRAAIGPKRQFAAVQRCGCYRWNSGRSMDAGSTAAPDPGCVKTLLGEVILAL
jgi:hypothetical protein